MRDDLDYHLDSASAPVDPHAPNFHSVNANVPESDLCGPLEANDLEWTCAGGFATETQTFYAIAEDGRTIMFQAIHSSVGYVLSGVARTFSPASTIFAGFGTLPFNSIARFTTPRPVSEPGNPSTQPTSSPLLLASTRDPANQISSLSPIDPILDPNTPSPTF